MSKTSKYPKIKQKLKNRQAASQAIHKKIHATNGIERHELWLEKRSFGHKTRILLLAYAMLRGVPYRAVEPKTHQSDMPFYVLWDYVGRSIAKSASEFGHELDDDAVKAWLKEAPEASQEAA